MTFDIYRIKFRTSINLEKCYWLNDKSHLSVSTGVCRYSQPLAVTRLCNTIQIPWADKTETWACPDVE